MICLICRTHFEEELRFTAILFLYKNREWICPQCQSAFVPISENHCLTCYKEGNERKCNDCCFWQTKGSFVCHEALYSYNSAMKHYFSLYKFQGDYLLRKVFSKEIKKALKRYSDFTLVPIPLSEASIKQRKFNQVNAFLDDTGINYSELLGKRDTIKQQSDKTRKERLQSQQAFYLKKQSPLPPKILLIDDIYTTGATIQLASAIFRENGVKNICSFSLAR
ncbi:ComF family protein [Streptococcus macacae]|uniref:ComF family protein n=1 Tax=Streptococcus macacae NCTC 11558 TaxID=764298 RepID=G5JY38_9STRE|nr:ComF family protein [Streptococcus macacae]EHJ51562.1 comF family protein [Streptococcus macacae NCTC 11558]SUN77955.1 late competence protein [Streptococcus macacae NCTC 11558]